MTVPTDSTLAEHAAAIRALGKQTVANIIEIGERLAKCKKIVGHGGWLAWIDREFGWSEQSARNFMHVYEMSFKSPTVVDLNLDMRSLYALAAPSTPIEAREAIIERAEAGQPIPVAEVKRVIDEAKGREQPAKKPPTKARAKAEPTKPPPPEPDDDDEQTIWRRGLVFRSKAAAASAAYEDWSQFTADDELVQLATQAAEAWFKVAAYLNEFEGARKPNPRNDIGPTSNGEAERLRARIEELQAEIGRLELSLSAVRAELVSEHTRRKAAEAKAAKPLLPPDEKDRHIAKLEAQVKKYALKIDGLQADKRRLFYAKGGMEPAAYHAVLKALHPDRSPSESEKNEAVRLFAESMKCSNPSTISGRKRRRCRATVRN